MKKYWIFAPVIAGLVCLLLFVPRFAHAAEDVEINSTNFPDSVFRQYVKDNFDTDKDNKLSTAEIEDATYIEVINRHISTMEGLEYLTSLLYLDCDENQLTSLDVSNNTALKVLYCNKNALDTIDISKNTELEIFGCQSNKLTALDISKNTALTVLACDSNQLTSLDVTGHTALKELYCYNNQLTSLDVTKNTALEILYCYNNQLSSLNVSKNTALEKLSCSSNQLTVLNVSNNKALEYLYAHRNQLTEINVTANTALIYLSVSYNQLTSLDVSKNTALETLYVGANPLNNLDVRTNTALKTLDAAEAQLTSLNVSKNTALELLYVNNNQLTSLNVSKNTELKHLLVNYNQLTSLDTSHNPKLEVLYTNSNKMKELDISACPNLIYLYEKIEKQAISDGKFYYHKYYDDSDIFHGLCYDTATKIVTEAGTDPDPGPNPNPFTDVSESDSYYNAVMWAVENGITSGTSATTFSPNASCTRYQFAVMLYKLNGKPKVGNVTLPFTDVTTSDSYYKAVAWAYTNGIISGTSKTTFSPKDEVTRYQVVQMLYKSIGKPAVSTTTNPFTDVKSTDSYYRAVLWAVEKKITKGTSATTFSPKATCKRYQMVVFLKKFNDKYHIK